MYSFIHQTFTQAVRPHRKSRVCHLRLLDDFALYSNYINRNYSRIVRNCRNTSHNQLENMDTQLSRPLKQFDCPFKVLFIKLVLIRTRVSTIWSRESLAVLVQPERIFFRKTRYESFFLIHSLSLYFYLSLYLFLFLLG